jgi:uncharacterized protein (TIGR00288 family)
VAEHESNLAVLVDFENMARPGAKGRGDFDIHLVLNRLADKGRVLVKRAYADWSRYRDARHELQNAGLGLIEMPSAREGAKNRADIQMAVDAMELAYSREHVDTFVIVSGDSDFTPLIGKLRELNKRVTGVGNRESTSELLIANCDEFIFYDLLAARGREARTGPGGKAEPLDLLRGTLTALQREGVEWPLASVVKDSMRRKYPAFDESDHGFSTFSKFLEDAAKGDIIRLETDPRSGTYRVELTEGRAGVPALPAALEERGSEAGEAGRRRRRRPRRGESATTELGEPGEAEAATEVDEEAPGAETFEFVVAAKPIEAAQLPPLDEPISYEDMIMLGPELGDDLPEELTEATDVDESGPPARSARRRRRRGASAEPEPTVADLATLGEDEDEEEAAPAAEDAAEAEAAALEAVAAEAETVTAEAPEADAEGESPSRRRRRRRSTTAAEPADEEGAPTEEPAAEAAPEPEAEAAPEATVEVEGQPEPPADAGIAVEPPADEEPPVPATRTRGRVPRGSVRATEAEPVADEAPAPKRRTRKKAEPAVEEAATAEVAEAPSEVAPAAKRRTRKKAEPTADGAATAEVAEAPAEDAPAPKRRTRKKAEPAADGAGVAEAPSDVATAPRRRTRKKAEPAAEETPVAEVAAE